MSWQRSSTVGHLPDDPVGEAVGASIAEILGGASVDLVYSPDGAAPPAVPQGPATAGATGHGPPGWMVTLTARLGGRIRPLVMSASTPLQEILSTLPAAGLRAGQRFWPVGGGAPAPLTPAQLRALRDTIVIEALSRYHSCVPDHPATAGLIADTLEFLIELGGSRVEAQDLTHGVIITDVLPDAPRLQFTYPGDLRAAKRAPLLFDGQRSLLVIDPEGRARTELQGHRLDRLTPGAARLEAHAAVFSHSGSLVAEATRRLGGIGFFLRADRTIWAFADGQRLVTRRGEHWSAFPLDLATAIAGAVGTSSATAEMIVRATFIIASQRRGAILAVVDDPRSLEGVVSLKDRYDLRNEFDPLAMQIETRLHHLIDAEELDSQTLARLAALDGATILDRDGRLLAYGAVVSSSDSRHEGARTAAAVTLSHTAEIVLKVSVDGDITVLRAGEVITTLLG